MSPEIADVLCDVLREVCRHLDIEEAAASILARLRTWLPVSFLLVRRWDEERGRLETAAAAGDAPWLAGPEALLHLSSRAAPSSGQREELLRWAAADAAQAWPASEVAAIARLIVPGGVPGPVAAGPLVEEGRLAGVLVLGGRCRSTSRSCRRCWSRSRWASTGSATARAEGSPVEPSRAGARTAPSLLEKRRLSRMRAPGTHLAFGRSQEVVYGADPAPDPGCLPRLVRTGVRLGVPSERVAGTERKRHTSGDCVC